MEKLFTDEELSYLPLGFQFFVKPNKNLNTQLEFQEKENCVKTDFYQTPQYQTDSHYKPLSKIIKNQQ